MGVARGIFEKHFDSMVKERGYVPGTGIQELKDDLASLEAEYKSKFEEQKQYMLEKGKEIEDIHHKAIINEIEKKEEGNPFGSYLIPVLKVSALYDVQNRVQKNFEEGKMHYKSYEAKMKWLSKTIAERTGDKAWDDTILNLGFYEAE
ncbi:hypothetical protein BCY91_13965 [Pelobium manganitolerans]|uniref:Uncharacterized protein n=2 Tax=Pelobium manganitolerans TaxID=1842495 RepID=A0A419SA91_9SPHI|nr:hypothetical protein BCY91_13965 [Pelobium manganitolerans]